MEPASQLALGFDTVLTLLAAGLIFVVALALGVVKYRHMARSPDHQAHPYIDIAHRSALLYSFATLLVAVFVELSAWSTAVNLASAGALVFFFVISIANYTRLGLEGKTVNQFEGAGRSMHVILSALIVSEVGGFCVLLAGFARAHLAP